MISPSQQEIDSGFSRSSVVGFYLGILSLVIFILFILFSLFGTTWTDVVLQTFYASAFPGLMLSGAEIVIAVAAIIFGYHGRNLVLEPQSPASRKMALIGMIIGYAMIIIKLCTTFFLIIEIPIYRVCVLHRCG